MHAPTDSAQHLEARVPLFGLGFRPFFLLAALFSPLALLAWVALLHGHWQFTPYGGPLFWHGHEMLFGFVMAVVAGFLLTAVQNWTGIPGVRGVPLVALVGLWCLGRLAMLLPLPPALVMAVDLSFLPLVALLLARPILHKRQYRNLVFVPVLLLMALGNGLAHRGALVGDTQLALQGIYLAAWMVVLVMTLLGGRILPMFTANGSHTARVENLPALELMTLFSTALLALVQASNLAAQLPDAANGALALLAAACCSWRLLRLGFTVTLRVPLLWSLHLAFYCLPACFLLLAWHYLAPVWPISQSTAMHALFVGAMGGMILSMMARVALGHTGRPLQAAPIMRWAFAGIFLAAAARVLGSWLAPQQLSLWWTSAALFWSLAYGLFLLCYWPVLTRPRVDGRPG